MKLVQCQQFSFVKEKVFRIKQIEHAYYSGRYTDWNSVSVLPLRLRSYLCKTKPFSSLRLVRLSKGFNSIKALFKTLNNNFLETVLMRYKDDRNSICLSSMSGCPVGCLFCATGKMGFVANLTVDEIIDQYLFFKNLLLKEGKHITNVDFMGMGEPLLNFDNVLCAIKILSDPKKIGLGKKKLLFQLLDMLLKLDNLLILILDHA